MPPSMSFPALTFSSGILGTIQSLEGISRCTALGFKKGFYEDLILVDSASNKFHVIGAKKISNLPLRFKVGDLLGLLAGNRRWLVEPIFDSSTVRLSIEDVKQLIRRCFADEDDYWEEMGDFEVFRDKIWAATSIGEIFAIFREFHVM